MGSVGPLGSCVSCVSCDQNKQHPKPILVMSVSSFRKVVAGTGGGGSQRFPNIPGTVPALQGLHLLAPTGIANLDSILGGGVPLGSVVLVLDQDDDSIDDYSVKYSKALLKYFLAEGVAQENPIFYGGCGIDAEKFLVNLPDVVLAADMKCKDRQVAEKASAEDDLRIAWRYSGMKPGNDSAQDRIPFGAGHHFDLHKFIAPERLAKAETHLWVPESDVSSYEGVFEKVKSILSSEEFSIRPSTKMAETSAGGKKNLLRIGVQDVGSLLWGDGEVKDLTRFLLAMRSLVRNHLGLCMVSASSGDFSDLKKIIECCDIVISLKAFGPSMRYANLFKHQHGFLELLKTSGFNSLCPGQAQGQRFVFRSARTKMTIEKIHLPPDGEDMGKSTVKDTGELEKNIDF